jgi:hypothetical protein
LGHFQGGLLEGSLGAWLPGNHKNSQEILAGTPGISTKSNITISDLDLKTYEHVVPCQARRLESMHSPSLFLFFFIYQFVSHF